MTTRHSPADFTLEGASSTAQDRAQRAIQPPRDALPAGTRLDEYELLSVLAAGQSSLVYLARDHGLQRQVAVKEYLPAALATRDRDMQVTPRSDGQAETFRLGLEAFAGEAALLAGFDHPALLRPYRLREANRSAYLVMPYYEGATLFDARRAMPCPPDEHWLHGLLLPLLGALEVLHDAACFPRDISPRNILLQPDGRPVLLDLGTTRHVVGVRSRMLADFVDPAFAPVEQYAESKNLRQGPWSSLYALAAVAYFCVTGREPVASSVRALDDEMEPLFEAVDRLGRSFPPLDYSVAFVSTIERSLSVRPQERLQSAAEFRRGLLGGRHAEDSVAASAAADIAQRPGSLPPLPPLPHESGAFEPAGDVRGADAGQTCAEARQPWPDAAWPGAEPTLPTQPAQAAPPGFVPLPQSPEQGIHDAHEAARWEALEAALAREHDDGGGSPQARTEAHRHEVREAPPASGEATAGGWRRIVSIAGAAVLLAVLGTGGWMLWSDYRKAEMVLQSGMSSMQAERAPAARLAPEPPLAIPPEPPPGVAPRPPLSVPPAPATTDSPASAAAIASQPPVAGSPELPTTDAAGPHMPNSPEVPMAGTPAAPAATPPAPSAESPPSLSGEAAGLQQSPPSGDALPDPLPAAAPQAGPATEPDAAAGPPTRPAAVTKEPDNPRALCEPRTLFALYRCMKAECARTKYFDHPECKYLRATDEVRPRS